MHIRYVMRPAGAAYASPMHILSIQSSVAYGYAGNSAATFPLQRLGHEVWPVFTVHFSNHTGYGTFRGMVFEPSDVADVVRGVSERDAFGECDLVLSGYLGSAGVAEVVLDAVRQVRAANPRAKYCCDPVMGDLGKGMFVAPDLPELIRSTVLPAADIVTPNAFELAYLAGTGGPADTATPADVTTIDGVLAAADRLRAMGPGTVLVTSVNDAEHIEPVAGGADGEGDTGELFGIQHGGAAADDTISMIAVDETGAFEVDTPRFPLLANGAGDVTAALFAAHLGSVPIAEALARTASSVHGILAETMRQAASRPDSHAVEIAIVSAQDAIANPACEFPVTRLR